jgi:sulfur-carrier protein adenylyltransferase/sulfurtransferase
VSRYSRQEVLPEVGAEGQGRLAAARVLVVGAGGLGVPVLQYLAGAGVGHLTVVDGDRVAEVNLHRQPLYRTDQVGRPKVEAAAEALTALNPEVVVDPRRAWLDPVLARELLARVDLALDCADTFAASLILSDACQARGIPLITASALGMTGYVAGTCGPAPSLRALFPDLPAQAASCETAGIMGPVVGALGALQAQMALSVILALDPSPLGQLLHLDASRWRTTGFRFDGAPEPRDPLPFVGMGELRPDDYLVDLRTEVPQPFRPEARHLSLADIGTLAPPPGTGRIIVACRTGLRAHHAGMALRHRGCGPVALLAVPGVKPT